MQMTIGALARAGVNVETVRYYQRRGSLAATARRRPLSQQTG